jgi:ATP-dependent phosphofructokinase / diphosphate-dependent phosphofructokinase
MVTTLAKGPIEKDAHCNVQLSGTGVLGDLLADMIRKELGIKRVRADTFGYLQRSFLGCTSETDAHEAREVGEKAVQFAIWHDLDGSVAIVRVGDYAVQYALVPLEEVAGKTRTMADEYINEQENGVTSAFRNYAEPLISSLGPIDRIAAPVVEKIEKARNSFNQMTREENRNVPGSVGKGREIFAERSKRFSSQKRP